jgi:DNA-directed RNA polymerase subunit RPC12/RpoP
MEKNMSSLKVGQEDYSPTNPEGISCDNCGKKFEKPLFTTISSGQVLKEYYACPKCLSKIISVDVQKSKNIKQPEIIKDEEPKLDNTKTEKKKETIPGCKNTIGFLKRRPKNTAIPEECFTCNKMIDCMAY